MGQPRLITAQLNRIQCGRQGWLQGPAFSCVILTERKMQGRTACVCVCVEKCLDGGESIQRWKRFQSISSKARPSYSWLETSPLTSTWYIIIPALWSRCNCLLSQAVVSKWCRERNYQRHKKTHWFVTIYYSYCILKTWPELIYHLFSILIFINSNTHIEMRCWAL